MTRGQTVVAIGSAAIACIVMVSSDASAGFAKVDPMTCRPAYGFNKGGDLCECGYGTPYNYSYEPELQHRSGDFARTYFCSVPDTVTVSVDAISQYSISGYSPTGSGSGARGCVQFTNGFSESCLSGLFPFPAGDFTSWSMPIPTNWAQYWNNAYVEIRLKGQSAGGIGASIRNIIASSP
jgi:hypothetical protein